VSQSTAIVSPTAPRRILVRGVNWLGDAVMSTPALLRLRGKFPQAHIALLTPEKLRDLWLKHPAVNETLTFADGDSPFAVGRKLRAGKFDLALVLPNSPRSALEVWLARIPQRIGYARPWRNWFLTHAVPTRPGHVFMHKRSVAEINELIRQPVKASPLPPSAHQMHEYLHLVSLLGASAEPLAPRLEIGEDEVQAAKRKFGLTDGLLFGLNPGAEYGPAKRWPVDRFIAAAKEIQQRTNCTWIIFGGKGDLTLAGQIESEIQNLVGQTTLRELCALFKCCRVVLTNDTGPMHLAAAVGTPVVVPFGSTSPELTGPGLPSPLRHPSPAGAGEGGPASAGPGEGSWRKLTFRSGPHAFIKSDAPCSPCFLRECPIDFRCMQGIGVECVVEAVLQTLAQVR